MSAQLIEIAAARNQAELDTLDKLASELPDEFTVFSNFYISYDGRSHEIDLFVVSPNVQVLVDVKGTTGLMSVDSQMWYPQERKPFPSPLKKLERHARALKDLLGKYISKNNLWIESLVVLPRLDEKPRATDDAADDQNIEEVLKRSVLLSEAPEILVTSKLRPGYMKKSLTRDQLQGISHFLQKQIPPPRTEYNDWIVDERLRPAAVSYHIEKYPAYHIRNRHAPFTLTRFPLLPHRDRLSDIQILENQYQTMLGLRSYPHQNVLPPEDAFFDEDDDALVLISPMVPEQRLLSACIEEYHRDRQLCLLTIDQILRGLAHLHKHQIVLRNLTPDSIAIDEENTVRLVGFEGVGTVFHRTITIRHHLRRILKTEEDKRTTTTKNYLHRFDSHYLAPEGYTKRAKPPMDLFSAGIIFYQMLVGRLPFKKRDEMIDVDCSLPPLDDKGLHQWLQKLTEHNPKKRFLDAQVALIEFEKLFPELRR